MTEIPAAFSDAVAGRPGASGYGVGGDDWLRRLPRLLSERLDAWDLTPDGPAWHGECALVLPVVRADGMPAALKLTWPHAEASAEHLALQRWGGAGAVRLLAADPGSWALLLERLDGDTDLRSVPIIDACEVIGGLFTRLDAAGGPPFVALADRTAAWPGRLAAGSPLVPRRLTEQAGALLADLAADPQPARLVHEDLHDANVLAPLDPARGDWLAIDPKPVAGEWAFAVAPIVWNRADAAARASSLRFHVRLRADVVADAAGLDPDRVRAWTFVRLTVNALEAAGHASADAFRTRMITLAKAFASD